jgi:hypothetical protein
VAHAQAAVTRVLSAAKGWRALLVFVRYAAVQAHAPRLGALRRHTCHDRLGAYRDQLTCGRRAVSMDWQCPNVRSWP